MRRTVAEEPLASAETLDHVARAFEDPAVEAVYGDLMYVRQDNPQRVVLKQQGGKLETIPRGEVEELQVSKVSLMPEGLEKQLKPQEIADLFAFLVLDKPPTDPTARKIKGAPK